MDQAITLRGAKLMQMAKRKLMIKPAPTAESSKSVSGSQASESSTRILEHSIQVLDKLIRLCNASSSKSTGGSSSSMNVLHTVSLKFNHAQCRYLDLQSFHDNLRNLVDEMTSLDPTSCDQCRAAAVEISNVTRNAESLVFNFTSTEDEEDSWLTKAVLYTGDDGLAASHQLQDQQWCVSVLEVVLAQLRAVREDSSTKHKTKKSTSLHHVPYWMIDRTYEIVEEGLVGEADRGLVQAVKLDQRNLLEKLRRMKHKHDGFFFRGLTSVLRNRSRSRVHEVTSYLLAKLDVDEEEMESFIERIHHREPWASDGNVNVGRGGEEFLLGTGKFGSVYKSEFLGIPTVVKVTSFYSTESFWNEVSVLATTRHPRLAQLVFASITEQELRECRLWTELLGKSLDSVFEIMHAQSQAPEVGVAVEIMLQVAEGMAFLHRRGVLHRDLNAFNVLLVPRRSKRRKYVYKRAEVLDEHVQVKITDFGLPKTKLAGSSSLESLSEVGETLLFHQLHRLPLWQAPEVFQDSNGSVEVAFTKKSDVYSFAMLCYQIISCRRPFSDVEGLTESLLFQLVSKERMRPSLPRECPAYLATVIERCWSHEPERRLSFTQVCLALRSFKGLMTRRQLQPTLPTYMQTLPFTPSDFGHLFSHFGLDFIVEIIAMHKRRVTATSTSTGGGGESSSLFMMMLEKEKRPELWPFPMESFLLWLATSVEQVENADGFGSAAEIIGDLMANWIGSNHDFEQAVFWYYKACTSRSKSSGGSARWKLGMCMENGLGIAKDEKRALGLYKQAAREGCASAHVEVGRCYSYQSENGSLDKAVAHYAKALEMVENSKGGGSGNVTVECVEFLMRMVAKAAREEDCVWAGKRMQEIAAKSRLGRLVVAGRECCNVRELVGLLGDWKIKEAGRRMAKMVLERLAIEDDILHKALLA